MVLVVLVVLVVIVVVVVLVVLVVVVVVGVLLVLVVAWILLVVVVFIAALRVVVVLLVALGRDCGLLFLSMDTPSRLSTGLLLMLLLGLGLDYVQVMYGLVSLNLIIHCLYVRIIMKTYIRVHLAGVCLDVFRVHTCHLMVAVQIYKRLFSVVF